VPCPAPSGRLARSLIPAPRIGIAVYFFYGFRNSTLRAQGALTGAQLRSVSASRLVAHSDASTPAPSVATMIPSDARFGTW